MTHFKTTLFPPGIPAERTTRAQTDDCSVWGEVPFHEQPSAAEQGAGPATAGEGKELAHGPAESDSNCQTIGVYRGF